jgi:hypothetical protein
MLAAVARPEVRGYPNIGHGMNTAGERDPLARGPWLFDEGVTRRAPADSSRSIDTQFRRGALLSDM